MKSNVPLLDNGSASSNPSETQNSENSDAPLESIELLDDGTSDRISDDDKLDVYCHPRR